MRDSEQEHPDTPRCNAMDVYPEDSLCYRMVSLSFARQLERELAVRSRERDEARAEAACIAHDRDAAIREREELRRERDELKAELIRVNAIADDGAECLVAKARHIVAVESQRNALKQIQEAASQVRLNIAELDPRTQGNLDHNRWLTELRKRLDALAACEEGK